MNVSYHERRERHFVRWIRWTAFFSILLSSASVASLSNLLPSGTADSSKSVALALGLIVGIWNAAALAFDLYGQLSVHAKFKGKWTALLVESGLMEESDRTRFATLVREAAQLIADEPPQVEHVLKRAAKATDTAYGVRRNKDGTVSAR